MAGVHDLPRVAASACQWTQIASEKQGCVWARDLLWGLSSTFASDSMKYLLNILFISLLLQPACEDNPPLPSDAGLLDVANPDVPVIGGDAGPGPNDAGPNDIDASDTPIDAGSADVSPGDASLPDAGPTEPCDFFANTGCEDGEVCHLGNTPEDPQPRGICYAAGTLGDGEVCERSADCGPELQCVILGNARNCAYFCDATNACEIAGQACALPLNGPDGPTGVFTCAETDCDLLGEDCPVGQSCVPNGTDTLCAGTAGLLEGEACAAPNACADGLICSSAMSCARLCTQSSGDECDDGQVCQPLLGFDAAGICGVGA